MDGVALTEHGNMFSTVPFYQKAQKAGINPIIGCETYVAVESRHNKKPQAGGGWGNNHLILLVQKICSIFQILERYFHLIMLLWKFF